MGEPEFVCAKCLKPLPPYWEREKIWAQRYGHGDCKKSIWLCGAHKNIPQNEVEELVRNPAREREFHCACGKTLRVRAWHLPQFRTEAVKADWHFFGERGWLCPECPRRRKYAKIEPLSCEVHRCSNLLRVAEETVPPWLLDFQGVLEGYLHLTPRQRAVVQYRYYDNLTFDEIGKQVNCTRERARQLLSSALHTLQRRLYLYEAKHG